MRKAHPKYKRVMKTNKKFYAHDEQNSARVGDVVRIRESASAEQAEALARWKRLFAAPRCAVGRSVEERSSRRSKVGIE